MSSAVREIRDSPAFQSFLDCLTEYEITALCDGHAHVSWGRQPEGIARWATEADIRELPRHSFSPAGVASFYQSLFSGTPVKAQAIVFDTPLRGYDLTRANSRLLEQVAGLTGHVPLFPFAVVTPDMAREDIEGWAAGGMRGFKVSPRTAPGYYRASPRRASRVALSDMLPAHLLEIANRRRLPIILHLPGSMASGAMSEDTKKALEEVLDAYPGVRLVLAHLGLSQTVTRVRETVAWVERGGLESRVYLDISTITVPEVLENALASECRLLFGTDMDFCLVERGRYLMVKEDRHRTELAGAGDHGPLSAVLVTASLGGKYRILAQAHGMALDQPLLLYQLDAIVEAARRLRRRRGEAETARRLRRLFHENAGTLLAQPRQAPSPQRKEASEGSCSTGEKGIGDG